MKDQTVNTSSPRQMPVDEVLRRLRSRVRDELAAQETAHASGEVVSEGPAGSQLASSSNAPSLSDLEPLPKFERRAQSTADLDPAAFADPDTAGDTLVDCLLVDYLNRHDADFILGAYRGLLGREPDAEGWTHFLDALRRGSLSKVEILGRIRYSKEGRRRARRVPGLLSRTALHQIYRIPVAGYLVRLALAVLRLPTSSTNTARLEAHLQHRLTDLSTQLDDVFARVQGALRDLESRGVTRQEAAATSQGFRELLDEIALRQSDFVVALEAQKLDASDITEIFADSTHGEALGGLSRQVEAISLSRIEEARARSRRIRQTTDRFASLTSENQSIQEHVAETTRLVRQTSAEAAGSSTRLLEAFDSLAQLKRELEAMASQKVDAARMDKLAARVGSLVEGMSGATDAIDGLDSQLGDYRLGLLEEQRRVTLLLEESRKRLPKPMAPSQIEEMIAEQDHLLDSMYSSLEDRFRGTRTEIIERLQVYVPRINEAAERTRRAPVVDLGCGRGEWLEILAEAPFETIGVDTNRTMVRRCEEAGLNAVNGLALEFLRDQRNASLGAVTAFHLLEHLPFRDVINILDESIRTLQPGGIAIFETPNPENLFVGATTFYADPTHQNPVFPPTLQFLLEQRGFVDVEILRPYPRSVPSWMEPRSSEDDAAAQINPILELLKTIFYVSPDFAVVGRKA